MKAPSLFFTPFESLKDFKIIPRGRRSGPGKKPNGKHEGIEKEMSAGVEPLQEKEKTNREVFLEAMAGVRQIKEFSAAFTESGAGGRGPRRPGPALSRDTADSFSSVAPLEELVSGKKKIVLEQTGEYIEWASPGASPGITRRLHNGEFAVREYIDLHGMSRDEAFEALRVFFVKSIREKASCVKVIHGRGLRSPDGPVLKEALKKWLQGSFRKHVVAYASARDCDGGLGAAYVLLRRAGGTKRFT